MPDWLIVSIVGSVILTALLNLLPMLFPRAARKAQERLIDDMRARQSAEDGGEQAPRLRVFFPWKAMLIGSVVLTVLVNLVGWFARS